MQQQIKLDPLAYVLAKAIRAADERLFTSLSPIAAILLG
jgi:hypothetical protein